MSKKAKTHLEELQEALQGATQALETAQERQGQARESLVTLEREVRELHPDDRPARIPEVLAARELAFLSEQDLRDSETYLRETEVDLAYELLAEAAKVAEETFRKRQAATVALNAAVVEQRRFFNGGRGRVHQEKGPEAAAKAAADLAVNLAKARGNAESTQATYNRAARAKEDAETVYLAARRRIAEAQALAPKRGGAYAVAP